ncbi:MAG: HlyD family efflux transporter periplasmic adaptor subunit [FCB group bacterium]|nr:HlyD family efflux transporter periplasmic adaptor subunit [FCB group bacterium]
MKQKSNLIFYGLTILITIGITKVWDHYMQPKEKPVMTLTDSESNKDQDHHEEEGLLSIHPDELSEFNIELSVTGPGVIAVHRDLTGEIVIDPDRLAHIGPRFPGIVKDVYKQLGDAVKKGEVLAVIESNESLTPYEVRSLIDGTIIEMHLTQGEMVGDNDHAFVVADLRNVWANLSIYQKDLPYIKLGQRVEIIIGADVPTGSGIISYISPILDEQTRTATARIILDNSQGLFKPGLFISGKVIVEKTQADVVVPKTAVQYIDDQPIVFVKQDEGFKPQTVHIGKTNDTYLEILSGLAPGMPYVSRGGFTLKAQLAKSSFGGGHGH